VSDTVFALLFLPKLLADHRLSNTGFMENEAM
jgi:hypothetical protein